MEDQKPPAVKTLAIGAQQRALRWFGTLLTFTFFAYSALVFFGTLPNPLDRYVEVGASNYRLLADGYSIGTPQYRLAVEAALIADGKITLATYSPLFGLWGQSLTTPYQMPRLEPESLEHERARLVRLIEASRK